MALHFHRVLLLLLMLQCTSWVCMFHPSQCIPYILLSLVTVCLGARHRIHNTTQNSNGIQFGTYCNSKYCWAIAGRLITLLHIYHFYMLGVRVCVMLQLFSIVSSWEYSSTQCGHWLFSMHRTFGNKSIDFSRSRWYTARTFSSLFKAMSHFFVLQWNVKEFLIFLLFMFVFG